LLRSIPDATQTLNQSDRDRVNHLYADVASATPNT